MIRALLKRDAEQIISIHNKFYKDEFAITELQNLTCGFASVDNNDKVISAGGIRTIMEMIIVTDKDVDLSTRQTTLYEMLKTAGSTTKAAGYNSLHAFVTDEKWAKYLIKHVGFQPIIGQGLIIKV